MADQNFRAFGNTKYIDAPSTSSQSVTFDDVEDIQGETPDVLVYNNTNALAFVRTGNGDVTAVGESGGNCDTPIPRGAAYVISKGQSTKAAVIMAAAPTNGGKVYFTPGKGF